MLENFPKPKDKQEKPQKSFKERILNNKAAKIAAILLMMLGSVEATAGTGGENTPENVKNKIEDARGFLKQIIPNTENSDKATLHTLNGQDIKTCKYPTGQEVTVSDNNDYVMVVAENGEKVFFDDDADGSIDRVVTNKEEEGERTFVHNAMYTLESMEKMAQEADVIANLMPKKVNVLKFNHEDGEVEFVDMSDGSSGTFTGDDAENLISLIQARYTQELEEIAQGLDK